MFLEWSVVLIFVLWKTLMLTVQLGFASFRCVCHLVPPVTFYIKTITNCMLVNVNTVKFLIEIYNLTWAIIVPGDQETGSVRVCVRPSDVEICFFSVISWPILILFVLSDRAWWGLQNFYTEFWNSLIMQIYANLFKINEKCYFSSISWPILILFVLSDRAGWGLQNFYTEFWNSLIMQIYANLFKINEKCYFSSISWPILILFVLSDRAGCGLQNFYTEFEIH